MGHRAASSVAPFRVGEFADAARGQQSEIDAFAKNAEAPRTVERRHWSGACRHFG